ncbi:MAG: hypothetical protein ABEJ87_05530 [Candidatus Nanohalobium sp.]
MDQTFLLLSVMGIVMAVSTAVAVLVYDALENSGEQAMVKMRLQADATFQEFTALKWGHVIQAAGLFILGFGAAVGNEVAVSIGRVSTLVQGTITIAVIYRWWRRFR